MSAPRYITLTDSEEVDYPLPDVDRSCDPKTLYIGSSRRSRFTGKLNRQRRAKKMEWLIKWRQLRVDQAEDGGIGFDALEALVERGEDLTMTLIEYEGATPKTYTVYLDEESFEPGLVDMSGRKRRSVSLLIREI